VITYTYTAHQGGKGGKVVTAEVQAENERAAAKLLTSQGLFPIEIKPKEEKSWNSISFGSGVSSKDRVIFTRQLSTLINAGLPLTQSLRTAADQVSNQKLHDIAQALVVSVEGGSTLSAALGEHPAVFNATYINLVAAGESSGNLDKTLERIANQQEKDAAIVSKIRSALLYPVIVLFVILAVLVFMLTTVLPQVAGLYKDLHQSLPFLTQILVVSSNFILNFWWLVIIALIGAAFGIRAYLGTASGREVLDRFKINVPVFGKLYRKVYMARFSRTLSTLLASGVPLLQGLEIVKKALGNEIIAAGIENSITDVKGGKALSSSLEGATGFMPLVPQMIKIGEQSGAIDNMLERVAIYYEDEVDTEVRNLSTTIEPIMMVVLGIVVGGVIAAVLLPIYGLVGSGGLNNIK
jgi:type II secretory pathway component PulF